MAGLLDRFLRLFFPQTCLSCGITLESGQYSLCAHCRSQISPLSELNRHLCPSCSRILHESGTERCYTCHLQDTVPGFNLSLFSYQDLVLKELYTRFKFESLTHPGREFARIIENKLRKSLREIDHDILCPVPVSGKTLRKRGFNQVTFILQELKIEYTKLLRRRHHRKEQNKLNLQDRMEQIQGQFSINETHIPDIKDRKILLIDDIYTTGSTLRECSHVLLGSGARSVHCITYMRG